MHKLYVLFEHASGYALFKTKEFEEIAVFVPEVRKSILNVSKFRSVVNLFAYQAFEDQKSALENMKYLLEGKLHNDLQLFLENNIPRTKQPVVLGVQEQTLADIITERLDINCTIKGAVPEIIRGIRHHFPKLIKVYKDAKTAQKNEFALGHNYSRERVKFDSTRFDSMIIQSLNLIDECERNINTFSIRVRGWYSCHFPELKKLVPHNERYISCVDTIGDRKNMPEDIEEKLRNILDDSVAVDAILHSAHNSMGMEISSTDLTNIKNFCKRIHSFIERRNSTEIYLKSRMNAVAPNISTLVGEMVGARLISRAGGLMKLAKLPASTVQVLGAEKRLFRCLKDKKKNLKLGYLYDSVFMGKTGKSNKGRLSRFLASKCSLASRADCFRKNGGNEFGSKLQQEVEGFVRSIRSRTLKIPNVTINGHVNDYSAVKKKRKSKSKNKVHNKDEASSIETKHKMHIGIQSNSNDKIASDIFCTKSDDGIVETHNDAKNDFSSAKVESPVLSTNGNAKNYLLGLESNIPSAESEQNVPSLEESSLEQEQVARLKNTPSKCIMKRKAISVTKTGKNEESIKENESDVVSPKKRILTRSQKSCGS